MAYLELTIDTAPGKAEKTAAALTAGGFSDLIIEDQGEFEAFLEENRACWDYIDEELQQQLQGLSQIKLYLEKEDTPALTRLETVLETLERLGVDNVRISVVDKGALDCTIKARVECAVFRSCDASEKDIPWGGAIR